MLETNGADLVLNFFPPAFQRLDIWVAMSSVLLPGRRDRIANLRI
ncbi:MAG: hypothetical protein ACFFD4_02155 [Candidatus Odinarchaeota archaeon]